MVAADTAGTVLTAALWAPGHEYTVTGSLTIPEAVETGDTWTFANMLPHNAVKIVAGEYFGTEFDTNASPTATLIIGDTSDTDGYLASKVAGSANAQLVFPCDGALLGVQPATRDVRVTLGGTVATAASTGTGYVRIRYRCSNASAAE